MSEHCYTYPSVIELRPDTRSVRRGDLDVRPQAPAADTAGSARPQARDGQLGRPDR